MFDTQRGTISKGSKRVDNWKIEFWSSNPSKSASSGFEPRPESPDRQIGIFRFSTNFDPLRILSRWVSDFVSRVSSRPRITFKGLWIRFFITVYMFQKMNAKVGRNSGNPNNGTPTQAQPPDSQFFDQLWSPTNSFALGFRCCFYAFLAVLGAL